jgi:hypothetical protein
LEAVKRPALSIKFFGLTRKGNYRPKLFRSEDVRWHRNFFLFLTVFPIPYISDLSTIKMTIDCNGYRLTGLRFSYFPITSMHRSISNRHYSFFEWLFIISSIARHRQHI